MLSIEKGVVGYDGGFQLNIEPLTIESHAAVALVGASGSGKTTFLHALAGALGVQLLESAVPINVGYVMHDMHLLPWQTLRGHIRAEQAMRRTSFDWPRFTRQLAGVGLDEEVLAMHPRELSLGMRQRLELLMAMGFNANVLLGDEVFSGMDQETKIATMTIVDQYLKEANRVLVFTSHFPPDVVRIATTILMVSKRSVARADVVFSRDVQIRLGMTLNELILLPEFATTVEVMK